MSSSATRSIRPDIVDSPFFLPQTDVNTLVEWSKCGNDNLLVTKASMDDVRAADEDREVSAAANENASDGGDGESVPGATMAELSIIAVLAENDTWVSPDQGWSGPRQYVQQFKDIKMNLRAVSPSDPEYAKDWTKGIKNLKKILDEARTAGYGAESGMFEVGKAGFKCRHAIFVEKDGPDDDGSYDFGSWPTKHEAARAALEDIEADGKLVINRLPAYTFGGNLMEPEEYMKLLPGATVALTFELTHWAFKDHKRDHFTADVVKIRVIEEQRRLAVSPKKRRWAVQVDLGSSPTKRART